MVDVFAMKVPSVIGVNTTNLGACSFLMSDPMREQNHSPSHSPDSDVRDGSLFNGARRRVHGATCPFVVFLCDVAAGAFVCLFYDVGFFLFATVAVRYFEFGSGGAGACQNDTPV
jgi:hypothetical protein